MASCFAQIADPAPRYDIPERTIALFVRDAFGSQLRREIDQSMDRHLAVMLSAPRATHSSMSRAA
jgi:hypothetical protein